jgi:hypothetical protein
MRLRFPLIALFWLPLAAAGAVDFSHEVVPLLKKHCAECHAGDKKKGGFSFNDRESLMAGSENGPVVKAGDAESSRLIEVILSTDSDEQMPPKGPRLTAAEVAMLKAWVAEGLPWQEGFAFKQPAYEPPLRPRRPELPAAIDGREHPVDRIVDAYLAERKLPRPEAVGDGVFARRAFLDITGLLPEPEVLQKFLDDPAPDKRTRLVEALLADDVAYAEQWLTFWNDLLRNDYGGTGFITGGRRQISKWLYEALVTNKPFDQFTRELIAPAGDESRGYIDGIAWRGDVSAGQTVEIQFAQSVSQSFLGINMKCASCHDSFIDRWKLDEAYGLAAIYSKRPLEIARCDKGTGRMAQAAWLFPELGQVDAKADQQQRLAQLAALMTNSENGRFTRTIVNRLWHRLMGRGIVHPVDAMQTEPWNADLLDHLATFLSDNGYDLKKVLVHIATSQAYQSQAQIAERDADDHGYTYAGPRAKRLTAEQFIDAVWQLTGTAPEKMHAPVLRGKPDPEAAKAVKITAQWLWGDSAAKGGRPPAGEKILLRKTLKLDGAIDRAAAVVTCDNAFVLAVNNRVVSRGDNWQALESVALTDALKEGANSIVIIAENAGANPNAAGLFFEARVKMADGSERAIASDESWEWHPTVPEVREGRIGAVPPQGWKPVTVVKPVPGWTAAVDSKAPALLAQAGNATTLMVRASLMKSDLLMRSLGRPNRDQIVSMRPNELTTLEAIDLANGEILAGILEKGAKRLLARRWDSPAAFVRWVYLSTLCREPTESEIAAAREALGETLGEQGIADLMWAVLMLPEFQMVR